MPKYNKYHAKWKANVAKCSKYHAKCKVTMPKCSKYHAKWQVLVPNCCKNKATGTGKESQNKFLNLRQKKSKNYSIPIAQANASRRTSALWGGNWRAVARELSFGFNKTQGKRDVPWTDWFLSRRSLKTPTLTNKSGLNTTYYNQWLKPISICSDFKFVTNNELCPALCPTSNTPETKA